MRVLYEYDRRTGVHTVMMDYIDEVWRLSGKMGEEPKVEVLQVEEDKAFDWISSHRNDIPVHVEDSLTAGLVRMCSFSTYAAQMLVNTTPPGALPEESKQTCACDEHTISIIRVSEDGKFQFSEDGDFHYQMQNIPDEKGGWRLLYTTAREGEHLVGHFDAGSREEAITQAIGYLWDQEDRNQPVALDHEGRFYIGERKQLVPRDDGRWGLYGWNSTHKEFRFMGAFEAEDVEDAFGQAIKALVTDLLD